MRRPVTVSVLPLLILTGSAFGNPRSIVPGGPAPNTDVSIEYAYELDRSTLVRERIGDPDLDPLAPIPTVRDLEFDQFRHTVTPRLRLGIFGGTFLSIALPIVITQARELRFLGDRAGSSTVSDGLLPEDGFDARDPGTATPGDLAFRSGARRGLDQVHVGLATAVMNQLEDATKPTWILGAELRLAIGSVMRFDAMAPEASKGVSRGVQELRLWTSFARKIGWAEPWFELSWLMPVATRESSLFQDPGFGATNSASSMRGGAEFGLELYALDNKVEQTRISLDLGSRIDAHFEGREYTEMWEIFALAGDRRDAGPLVLDADPTAADTQPVSHPGISNIEGYLQLGARFAIRAQVGPHVRFAAGADVIWKTDHAISFADAGVDRDDENDLVNPGTDEVNPLHAQQIDLVGHRYRSVDGFDVVIGVNGQVLF